MESWPLSVILRVMRGPVRLWKGEISQMRGIHTEKTKTITIIDTRIRVNMSTSWGVEGKMMFGGQPPMYASRSSIHIALQRRSADLLAAGCRAV